MSSLKSTLLFAAAASAQVTTSFWMVGYNSLGTDKLGYVASVIGANQTHTTLELNFDDGTDTSALGLGGAPYTMTFAPNAWEQHTTSRIQETISGYNRHDLRCEKNPEGESASVTCTATYGKGLARRIQCNTGIQEDRTYMNTITNTYPGRLSYSSGVETFTQTLIYSSRSRSTPAWCGDRSAYPSEDLTSTFPLDAKNFGTYQVVITAGTEKLQPTQGATPSANSAVSTTPASAPTGSTSATVRPSAGTGAAGSVSAMGSLMVGFVTGVTALVVQFV